jgi:mRNA interferase RelE/StbE
MYKIIYHAKVVKDDIAKLDQKVKYRIKKSIESKLIENPELYSNQLRNTLSDYRKLRVGDYRVIFKIVQKNIIILIIGHRKDVYKLVLNRD